MCCIIILSHFEFLGESEIFGEFYKTYLHNPTLAVDYFFMLSGFGIYLSSKRPECSIKGGLKFAVDKVKKIYPAYIVSLFIATPVFILQEIKLSNGFTPIINTVIRLFVDFTLLQSLTGILSFTHGINGVCWFLSSLFVIYMLSPLFLRKLDSMKSMNPIRMLLFTLFTLMLFSFGAYYIESLHLLNGRLNDIWYTHPFVRCWYVVIGMIVGKITSEKTRKYGNTVELLMALISLIFCFLRNSISLFININALRIIDVVVCSALLYVFANGKGKLSSLLCNLSGLSKYLLTLYLFHYPVRMAISFCFEEIGYKGEIYYLYEVFLIISFTIFLVSLWTYINRRKGTTKYDNN